MAERKNEQAAESATDALSAESPVFRGLVRGMLPLFLLMLLKERPLHGSDMIRSIAAMSEGHWKPSPGSVYPILRRLEEEGLITGRWRRSRAAPQRVYRLTDKGHAGFPQRQRQLLGELRAARELIDGHIEALERILAGGEASSPSGDPHEGHGHG